MEQQCRECGQRLIRATYYEGSASLVTADLLWCANVDCSSMGVMVDPVNLEPKLPVPTLQHLSPEAELAAAIKHLEQALEMEHALSHSAGVIDLEELRRARRQVDDGVQRYLKAMKRYFELFLSSASDE
jgi:hypothetical protein